MNWAILGGFGKVPFAPGWTRETAVAFLGGGELDLAASQPGAEAQLTAVAAFGGIDVLVPQGGRVSLSGLSLFGGRQLELEPGDGPLIRIRAYALFGGVNVKAAERLVR